MNIHWFGLVLLVVCFTVLPADAQPAAIKPRYIKFLNQHFHSKMATEMCTSVIRSRQITAGDTNDCKETNTFVKANTNDIRAVCGNAGKQRKNNRNLYDSTQPFPVIICKLRSQGRYPNCEYRGVRDTRFITIACEEGWPVHYDGDIIDVQ